MASGEPLLLGRLLEMEPVVSGLVFTELRGGIDGYVVGVAYPDKFRRSVERLVPPYAATSAAVPLPQVRNLADPGLAEPLGQAFQRFLEVLPVAAGGDADPVRKLIEVYVRSHATG